MVFSERIASLREEMGMNKKEFAEFLGISYAAYNSYETGSREPRHSFLILVADKLNVSIDYLLGLSEKKEKPPAEAEGEKDTLLNLIDSLSEDEAKLLFEFAELLLRVRAAGK